MSSLQSAALARVKPSATLAVTARARELKREGRDVIGAMTNAWMLYFGTMFVLLVLFRPEGIAGAAKQLAERWKTRRTSRNALSSATRSG